MAHLVFFDFPSTGPFGDEGAALYGDLAADIAGQDGLVWKVWTEDPAAGRAGGAYLFVDRTVADAYVDFHTQRLASFGITDITTVQRDVNDSLSTTTFAALSRD